MAFFGVITINGQISIGGGLKLLSGQLTVPGGSAALPDIVSAADKTSGIRFFNQGVRIPIAGTDRFDVDLSNGLSYSDGFHIEQRRAGSPTARLTTDGELKMLKNTTADYGSASGSAVVGAGFGALRIESGTNAGTVRFVVYGGTSTAGATVFDNIGGGA